MNRTQALGLALAAGLLLAGCASADGSPPAGAPAMTPAMNQPMTPGMTMPDGSVMGGGPASSTSAPAASPSAAAAMVCAAETHADIVKVLGLSATPPSHATWANHLYTCAYRLPMGPLVISVEQSADRTAAGDYFAAQRKRLGNTESLDGLGESSYGQAAGRVVLRKDNFVLTVDATRLPPVFGAQQSKRFDFAYEIASDILGCWTNG